MFTENFSTPRTEEDFSNQPSSCLEFKEQAVQSMETEAFVFKLASRLAVQGYRSARLGCEVCYGLLPETYD